MNALIRNIPSIVFAIMIATCVYVDLYISHSPGFLLSKIPVLLLAVGFTVVNNMRRGGEGGGDA